MLTNPILCDAQATQQPGSLARRHAGDRFERITVVLEREPQLVQLLQVARTGLEQLPWPAPGPFHPLEDFIEAGIATPDQTPAGRMRAKCPTECLPVRHRDTLPKCSPRRVASGFELAGQPTKSGARHGRVALDKRQQQLLADVRFAHLRQRPGAASQVSAVPSYALPVEQRTESPQQRPQATRRDPGLVHVIDGRALEPDRAGREELLLCPQGIRNRPAAGRRVRGLGRRCRHGARHPDRL